MVCTVTLKAVRVLFTRPGQQSIRRTPQEEGNDFFGRAIGGPALHFVHPGGLIPGAVTRTLKSKQHCARKCGINAFQRADAAKKRSEKN